MDGMNGVRNMRQMDIYDFLNDPECTFKPGQTVEVVGRPQDDGAPEDYYYLREFVGKRGTVTTVHTEGKELCYSVDFGGTIGVFYPSDLVAKEETR